MNKRIDLVKLHAAWLLFLAMLKIDLYSFQTEMSDGLLQLPEYADCTQTRQSGKSFLLGLLIYFLAYYLKWDIIICAPKLDATEHIMDVVTIIASWMKRKKKIRHPVHSTKKIRIEGRGSVKCISGDPFAFVEGSHAHLIVFDEKQSLVRDHIVEKILPFRGFHNGLIWSLGIGGEPRSWGETSRAEATEKGFVWNCPWQRVVEDKPEYLKVAEDQKKLMFPVQFAAHYECKELDMSAHLLITSMEAYQVLPQERAEITIGLDFGSIDKTVATVSHHIGDKYYWHDWLVLHGDYSNQIDRLTQWLQEEVEYDKVVGEYNGVGRGIIDTLNGKGLEIIPININLDIKTEMARRIRELTSYDRLRYNSGSEISPVFYQDITNLQYKMTGISHVKVDHSDFFSSGILTILEAPKVRIAA